MILPYFIIKQDDGFYLNKKTDRFVTHAELRKITDEYYSIKGSLTKREFEYLQFLVKDMTHKEIAKNMGLSHRTIDSYRDTLLIKTNSRGSIGIVVWAIKNYLVDI